MVFQMLLCGECYENDYTKAYKLSIVQDLFETSCIFHTLSFREYLFFCPST
jgi:hypothetical protein